jgi:hypothetical protein
MDAILDPFIQDMKKLVSHNNYTYMYMYQELIQDFFVEGEVLVCGTVPKLGGSGGMLPQNFLKFYNLCLRLFLVVSETTYMNKKYIILLYSTICISRILGKFRGGGGIPGCPPLCIYPCVWLALFRKGRSSRVKRS